MESMQSQTFTVKACTVNVSTMVREKNRIGSINGMEGKAKQVLAGAKWHQWLYLFDARMNVLR